MVGEPVEGELQHPLFALPRVTGSATGLPVDDLDAVAAVGTPVDGVEFADHDVT